MGVTDTVTLTLKM